MSRSTLTMAVAVTILFVAPLAGAKWMAYGTYEPDTSFDTAQFMTQNGPGTAVNSTVYFNAFPKNVCATGAALNTANGCWLNPNSGDLETSVDLLASSRTWHAILGIWTDCNGDGYIGLRESAAAEYRADVLRTPLSTVGETVCPPKVGSPEHWSHTHADNTVASPGNPIHLNGGARNNWNNWVTELIPIGGIDYDKGDKRVFVDPRAMVWAEPGVPDAAVGNPPPPAACRGLAGWQRGPANAQNEGDAHTLGGILAVTDCYHGGGRVAGVSLLETFDTAAAGSGLEWGSDPKHSPSPLNVNVGDDDADKGGVIFKAQDCGSGHYGPGPNDPNEGPSDLNTGENLPDQASDFEDLTLLRPIPPGAALNTNPGSWSIPATINYTLEASPEMPGQETGGGPGRGRDCNFDNDPGYDFYGGNWGGSGANALAIEQNPQVFLPTGKVQATSNAVFNAGARGSVPLGFAIGGAGGTDRASNDAGFPLLGAECVLSSCVVTQWIFGAGMTRGFAANAPLFRGSDATVVDLANPFPDSQPITFYAYVDPNGIVNGKTQPLGGGANYGGGANSCGTFGADSSATDMATKELRNWQCNPNLWYRSADGLPITRLPQWCTQRPCQDPGYAAMLGLPANCPNNNTTLCADLSVPLAKVHQPISYRDVDCLDGSIGSVAAVNPSGLSAATKCSR